MTNPHQSPYTATLMRLRDESGRTDDTNPEGLAVAGDISKLILSHLEHADETLPSDVLRSVAVAMAEVRQRFLSDNHLSVRELREAMPMLSHLSAVAEELVALSDGLAEDELDLRFVDRPAAFDGPAKRAQQDDLDLPIVDDFGPLDDQPDGLGDGNPLEW